MRWDFYEFQQFQFNEQWSRLKAYANENGIQIIGDKSPSMWLLTGLTAGLIRSCSSLMGNVCQRQWPAIRQMHFQQQVSFGEIHCMTGDIIKKDHYSWWIKRMEYCLKLYDVVRVDHFRVLEAYYSIPYGDLTAEFGHWEKGPGLELFDQLKKSLKKRRLPIIAEGSRAF